MAQNKAKKKMPARDELSQLLENDAWAPYGPESDEARLRGHLESACVHFDEDKPARIAFAIRKFCRTHAHTKQDLQTVLERMLEIVDKLFSPH